MVPSMSLDRVKRGCLAWLACWSRASQRGLPRRVERLRRPPTYASRERDVGCYGRRVCVCAARGVECIGLCFNDRWISRGWRCKVLSARGVGHFTHAAFHLSGLLAARAVFAKSRCKDAAMEGSQ
eukprot:3283576-Alexandrium_andersonii.AAC.1